MADFAIWGMAAGPALGWTGHNFLDALDRNRRATNDVPLDASPLTGPIRALVALDSWEGTVGDLLTALNDQADERIRKHRAWPRDATRLGGALRRLAPSLRGAGIDVTFGRRTGEGVPVHLERRPTTPDDPEEDGGRSEQTGETASSATPATPPSSRSPGGCDGAPSGEASVAHEPDPLDSSAGTAPVPTRQAAGSSREPDVAAVAVFRDLSEPVVLSSDAALREMLPELLRAEVIGLDTETTGLDARSHRARLVQLAIPGKVVVVDCFRVDARLLTPLFEDGPTLIGHNLKFDLAFLAALGLPIPDGARLFDTMLAAQLLGAGLPEGQLHQCGLAAVCRRSLDQTLDKSERLADWSGELTEEMLAYATADAAVLLPLAERLRADLAAARLERATAIEMRALPAVIWLEQSGAPFESDAWQALSDGAVAEQVAAERELDALVGRNNLFGEGTVNWGAPEQVKRLLRERGHVVEHADEATLRTLLPAEPLAAPLLRHRDASKRASTYGIEFLNHVHPATGRIHADYLQLGAASGRMSCTKPNLQNIPRDPKYRACFRPAEGRALVKADYSQIELRIAAEISGDPRMLQAYGANEDLHTLTAAAVLGRATGEVRPEDRQAAKALNFGLLYGMGAERLRQHAQDNYGVVLTATEAEHFRSRFFQTYDGLRRWHRSQTDGLLDTRTLAGRRRRRVSRFTEKLNTPVQGTGADGLKAALALLWETRDRCPGATPVLCVHDEVVLECDADRAEEAAAWLRECMTGGMANLLQKVPVEVETKIATDWSGKACTG